MKNFDGMLRLLCFCGLLFLCSSAHGQKYFTKDGRVTFESDAPLEKIESVNNKALCVWDTETGAVQVSILIKSFRFEKALMQEHFNENYLESEKYPKAIYKGTVSNMSEIDLTKDGEYTANISGEMSMHGVKKAQDISATVSVKGGEIQGVATFDIAVADYDIEIPKVVKDNVAKIVHIKAEMDLKPLEK